MKQVGSSGGLPVYGNGLKPGTQDITNYLNTNGKSPFTDEGISGMGGEGVQLLMQGQNTLNAQNNQGSIASDLSRQNAGFASDLSRQNAGFASDLSRQNSEQDMTQGRQSGDYGLLSDILAQGGLSDAQRGQATSRYNDVLAQLRTASGYAGNMAQNGLYTDAQRAGYMDNFNVASGSARDMAANGGYSDSDMNLLNGNYGDVRNRYTGLADNGALRASEYQQSLASGRQDVMDSFKNAAESTFNQSNRGGSPFGGGAIMANGAREAGANMARVRADLDKYQADTRMKGIDGLSGVANDQAGLYSNRAGNRLAGTSELGSLAGEYGNYMKTDAGGKLEAINQLNSIANSGINVSDGLAKIDTMASDTANQGLMQKLQERLGYQAAVANAEQAGLPSDGGGTGGGKKAKKAAKKQQATARIDNRLKYNSGSRA